MLQELQSKRNQGRRYPQLENKKSELFSIVERLLTKVLAAQIARQWLFLLKAQCVLVDRDSVL